MLRYVIRNCRVHICDVFDEIPFMASRGPFKSLFKNLYWYHCLYVSFHFYKFHEVLGSDWILALEFILKSCSHWRNTGIKML